MKILWMSICIALVIASVDAKRSLNFSKPITNAEKRPRPMTWLRPPEERRRLPIFPKNSMKFVITPKPVVESEESTTGLSTKRPLMRKFIVHDKNEKGSWYFVPREPLMQTKRFTVTMAPPRLVKDESNHSLKSNDEIAEESKKMKTVINDSNTRQQLNKVQIHKGNLIDSLRNKKSNIATVKKISQVNKVDEKERGHKQTNTEFKNDSLSDAISDNHDTLTVENEKELSRNNNRLPPSNIEDILRETIEGRSLYLNDKTPVGPYENSVLSMNKKTSKGNKNVTSNMKGLELLMENIFNGTASSNYDTPTLNSGNDESIIIKNLTSNKMDHYISPELYTETKNVHQAKLINEKHNPVKNVTNTLEQILKAAPLISDQPQNSSNKKQNIDVDTVEKYIHEPIVSTTELDITTHDHVTSVPDLRDGPQTKSLFGNYRNLGIGSIFESTTNNSKIENYPPADSVSKLDKIVLDESLDEQYNNREIFEDVVIDDILSVTEVSNGLFLNISDIEASKNVSNESMTDLPKNPKQVESNEYFLTGEYLSNESLNDNSNNLTEESSNESPNDKSNNYTDEASNESTLEKINNFTDQETSKKSNVTSEEILNESINNNSNSLAEETSTESQIDKSKNYPDEESNESNMASEDVSHEESSNESIIDKSNYTDEVSNESAIDRTDNLTGESISNESNMAAEEISIELGENSDNLTEEIVESLIDMSLTTEDISEEALFDKANNDEDISQKPRLSSERNIPGRFIRSNNIIEEENLPTTVSGFKYTGHEVSLSQDLSFKNINA